MITLQYLEYSPQLASLNEGEVVARLRSAYERLPFSHLLIGWNLPPHLLESCRMEAGHLGIRFLRWQPLLTSDGLVPPHPAWQVVGATGQRIEGYQNLPEFTFSCPNHPEIQEWLVQRIDELIRVGLYQGFFLDRVRYPSPTADPVSHLGCFCEHCRQRAAGVGLDLEHVRRMIIKYSQHENGRVALVLALLGEWQVGIDEELSTLLKQFLQFRQACVSDLVRILSGQLRAAHQEVGLDCFTPSLVSMVGQDLGSLSQYADWIKLMTYAHTLGPAGIPYEFLHLYDFLAKTTSLEPVDILRRLGVAAGLPLPASRHSLAESGLSPMGLQNEVRRGIRLCSAPVLTGIELVELEGVTHFQKDQLIADLHTVRSAGAAGLSISWDLLHIPLERLSLVKQAYF
jgi:hypothetical protein